MARLNFPTAATVRNRMASATPGETVRLDRHSQATLSAAGEIIVTLNTDTDVLVLAERSGDWLVTASQTGTPAGHPLALPEALIARANRLWSQDTDNGGNVPTVQRNWRTKTHDLRAYSRRVLPITASETLTLRKTGRGWDVFPAGAALPTPAPLASTEAPEVQPILSPPEASPAPAPSAPSRATTTAASIGTGIPAAYRGDIVLSRVTRAKWLAARESHRQGDATVIAMVGPSGAGKTHAVHALAAAEGLEVVKFDASGVVEPGDWFGTVTLDGQGTHFVPSDLLSALTLPGARVLLIDEANRAAQRALNAMLPVFDGSGTFTVPQTGKRERINPAVQIVVTANIGSQFMATEPLDEAIRTRVSGWIEVEHLAEDAERDLLLARVNGDPSRAAKVERALNLKPAPLSEYDAGNLATLGSVLRLASLSGAHPPVSTRQLLAAARFMRVGLDARLAVDMAVVDGYLAEGGESSERAKVRVHVAGITWKQPKPGQVMTGTGLCQCGHDGAQHGIGTEVSVSTHCRTCARNNPGRADRQCMAYSEAMSAEDDGEDDESF